MPRTKTKNQVPAVILRSPLHRLMSNKTLLLSYTGRRSGKEYATPINYHRVGPDVLVATDSPWWHNFETPLSARVRLQGRDVAVTGQVVSDADEAADALSELVRAQPSYGRWAHVRVQGGEPDPGDVRTEIARGRHVIRLQLEGAGR
jgi:deazaflavin-dependent oxidoreductase (nitroreductase family)